MSYSGTQVYFPASTSFDAVRDTLATHFKEAKLSSSGGTVVLAFDDAKVIRVSRDDASHVPVEAQELAERAEPAIGAVLEQATHRYEIVPVDPRADPDDMYNELLFVFEVLREMPNAVGMDPFDGAMYLDAPAKAEKPVKAPAKKPVKKAAKKPAKNPSKKSTKKLAKRSTKKSKER